MTDRDSKHLKALGVLEVEKQYMAVRRKYINQLERQKWPFMLRAWELELRIMNAWLLAEGRKLPMLEFQIAYTGFDLSLPLPIQICTQVREVYGSYHKFANQTRLVTVAQLSNFANGHKSVKYSTVQKIIEHLQDHQKRYGGQ